MAHPFNAHSQPRGSARVSIPTRDAAVNAATREPRGWRLCRRCIGMIASYDAFNKLAQGEVEKVVQKGVAKLAQEDSASEDSSNDESPTYWEEFLCLPIVHFSAINGCALCESMVKRVLSSYAAKVQNSDVTLATRLLDARDDACDPHQQCPHSATFQDLEMGCHWIIDTAVWIKVTLRIIDGRPHPKEPGITHYGPYHILHEGMVFDVYPSSPLDISATYLKSAPPNMDVSGAAAEHAARAFLERCNSECTLCTSALDWNIREDDALGSAARLPTRLIDVSKTLGTDLALISTAQGFTAQYATLSYCWGAPYQPHATTTDNAAARGIGMSSCNLPQTFADAIRVTRLLGFNYLWIDALCIIQDSAEDKKREVRKIKDIFEGSALTIVAASAAAAEDGFLADRRLQREYDVPQVPFWCSDGRLGCMDLVYRPRSLGEIDPWDVADPVQKRAWTFEEFILSRRRLCYTSSQLVWSCQGFQASDGGSNFPGMRQQKALQRLDARSMAKEPDIETFLSTWAEVLGEYTSRQLTHARDRLIAIEGIARRLENQMHWQYHTGVWCEQLVYSLCWRRKYFQSMLHEPRESHMARNVSHRISREICPSWSWGSITAPVEMPPFEPPEDVIDDVQVRICGLSPPILAVHGWLIRVTHAPCTFQDCYIGGRHHLGLNLEKDRCYFPYVRWDTVSIEADGVDLWYVPLRRPARPKVEKYTHDGATSSWQTCGLLLSRVSQNLICYTRVGFVLSVSVTRPYVTYDNLPKQTFIIQ